MKTTLGSPFPSTLLARTAASALRGRARARRITFASLGTAGLAILVAACSASPTESTASGESAISGAIKPMVTWSSILTRSSTDGQITNGNGGCLDLPNGDTTNGNLLHIWQCDTSGWNQTWYVDTKGSIHYAADPEKCVDFPAQSLVNGVPTDQTQLQIWDCNGASGPDQVWQPTITGTIEFAADTAKCIELRNGSSANNTPVQVFDCNGTSGQTWQLVQVGTALQGFQLQDANGGCLQPVSTAAGAALELALCNGSVADQQWGIDGRSAGLFNYSTGQYVTFPSQDITATTFVPQTQLVMANESFAENQAVAMNPSNHTMLIGGLACIEARNGSSAPGTAVQGFTCNGTSGQTWFPKPMGGACAGPLNASGACVTCGTDNLACCVDATPCTDGTVCQNKAGTNECLPCPAGTVRLNNACLPSSHTWTFPETDGTDFGVHPQTLTVNWDGSWSWQGQFWMNYGPLYASANDIVVITLTTSEGKTYYLTHTGSLSGFGNSSDPGNGDWNDSAQPFNTTLPGDWAQVLTAKFTTKGELNATAAGVLGDIGIVAGTAVLIGAASD